MKFYDNEGHELRVNGVYFDSERKVLRGGDELCMVKEVCENGFAVLYSGGDVGNFSDNSKDRASRLRGATLGEIATRVAEYKHRIEAIEKMQVDLEDD